MAWFEISLLSTRKLRKRQGKTKEQLGKKKQMSGGSRGIKNMKGEGEGVIRVIGTDIVIETVIERESITANVIMKGLESGMVGGGLIGEAGTGTMIIADHGSLLGMVTGDHLEDQFIRISGFCR